MPAPVKALSGGERARLLLAKLFSKPANLLVLDEPTNDLDVETLELLEEVLLNFPGTVLMVSHDRAFLDNVVTSTLVFEGRARARVRRWLPGLAAPGRFAAPAGRGRDQVRQGRAHRYGRSGPVQPAPLATASEAPKKKLSYKLQRELEALPGQIETLEAEMAAVQQEISDPAFCGPRSDPCRAGAFRAATAGAGSPAGTLGRTGRLKNHRAGEPMAVEYRITLDDEHEFSYRIELDRQYDQERALAAPKWTRLEFQQCSNCPLSRDKFSHCPAAVDLHRVIEDFHGLPAFKKAVFLVRTPGGSTPSRWAWKKGCGRCSG